MASMAMTASFPPAVAKLPSAAGGRRLVVVKASTSKNASLEFKTSEKVNQEKPAASMRRDVMFAVAAATACSLAKLAMAEEEPKRGTLDAKKKYAPICVTMPTARICHK